MSQRVVGILYIIAASLAWSGTALWVKLISMPPAQLAFVRVAVPTLLVGSYLVSKRNTFEVLWSRPALAAGILNAVRLIVWTAGMRYLDVGGGIVLTYTSPVFSAILSYFFLGEQLRSSSYWAFLFGISGVVLVTDGGVHSLSGSCLVILSAFIWGIVNVSTKHCLRQYSTLEMVFAQSFFATIVLAFAPFVYPAPSLTDLALGSGYGIVTGTLGFVLYMKGLTKIPVAEASIITYLEVVFAMVLAFLLLGESPNLSRIGGALLIIVSGAFIAWGNRKQTTSLRAAKAC